MLPTLNLATIVAVWLHFTFALSRNLHFIRPSNKTTILSSLIPRPNPLRDEYGTTCFQEPPWKRPKIVSLEICQATFDELEARPDANFQHTYGGRPQQRVKLTGGPCAINLYPKLYGGIVVMKYTEVVWYVKEIFGKCEEFGRGGSYYLGLDWFIEVLGADATASA